MYLLDLLGKTIDNPAVKAFQARFPHYDLEPTDRGEKLMQRLLVCRLERLKGLDHQMDIFCRPIE